MKDLNDALYGRDFEFDDYGLLLPPGTKDDVVYEKHGDYSGPLLFVQREQEPDLTSLGTSLGHMAGFEIRGDKVYTWNNGERVEQHGLDAIKVRAQARSIFGGLIEPE